MEAAWTPAPYSLPLDDLYANDPPHRFLHNDIVYIVAGAKFETAEIFRP